MEHLALLENINEINNTIENTQLKDNQNTKNEAKIILNMTEKAVRESENSSTNKYLYRRIYVRLLELKLGFEMSNMVKIEGSLADLLIEASSLSKPDVEILSTEIKQYHHQARSSAHEADEKLNQLKRTLEKTQNLANLVAENSIKNGFNETAQSEKFSANFFRWSAICVFLIGIAISGYFLHEVIVQSTQNNIIEVNIFRIVFVILISIFAYCLFKESTAHRISFNFNKKMALDIEALEPFIAGLDQKTQSRIKLKLALKFFGPSNFLLNSHKDKNVPLKINISKLIEQDLNSN